MRLDQTQNDYLVKTKNEESFVSLGDCDLSEIPNGRASLRMRGRAIQFVCDDDFILFGESYINCVNNIWADPPPRCVGKQTTATFNPIHGFIMYNYNSRVLIKLVNMYF